MGLGHVHACNLMCVLLGSCRNAGEIGWGRASKSLRSVGSHLNGKNDQRHTICAEFAKNQSMTLLRPDLLRYQPHVL